MSPMPPVVSLPEPADPGELADAQARRHWNGVPWGVWLFAGSCLVAGLAVGIGLYRNAPGTAALPGTVAAAAVPASAPAEPAPPRPLFVAAGNDPEARLARAYAALAEGDGRKAFEITERLVQDHPGFHLAHLLHGDMLAARSGLPARAFAGELGESGRASRQDIEDLRSQALRRLAALSEKPPAGHLPREMVELPAHVKYAVAVDSERSRLYLFRNGTKGMELERDFYVSLGKQGIGKRQEGDARTPLGVYWITNALPSNMLDERFGSAALGINYPNALDRHAGRTGTGLFLHGVPAQVYSHNLWATDGCVALANDDVELLLKRLDVAETPVVIAQRLEWVPADALRGANAEFRAAHKAWDDARRAGDTAALARWYENEQAMPAPAHLGTAPRGQLSLLAWYGDAQPVMVATMREDAARGPGNVYRQYWVKVQGQWRIRFDGPVPPLPQRAGSYARGG